MSLDIDQIRAVVAAAKGENPYRETALGEVATTSLESGNKEEALGAFNEIIASSKEGTPGIRARLLCVRRGLGDRGRAL